MKNGDFAIFYIKDGQLYPVSVTREQYDMLQLMIPSILDKKITLLDKPQGRVINLKETTKKCCETCIYFSKLENELPCIHCFDYNLHTFK